jgi:1-acyl-sn-glycerol-3-phosphate acyltransferase
VRLIQTAFFLLVVRPLVFIVVGLNPKHLKRLPKNGPAVIVANHNSHLDTLVLMSVFPLKTLRRLRPVAAADYFLKNKWIAWFSLNVLRIIPIARKREAMAGQDPLAGVSDALKAGEIVILFPEGSRGDPEMMSPFRMGIAKLAESFPSVPICPVYLHGLGKSLPRGEALLVPFFCDVVVGKPRTWNGEGRQVFLESLEKDVVTLRGEIPRQAWD